MTFANRRTAITDGATLRQLLQEDEYEVAKDPSPGDAILYLSATGEIIHSGIIIQKQELGIRVLSKWGAAHEVIHLPADCPYQAATTHYEYWRICK